MLAIAAAIAVVVGGVLVIRAVVADDGQPRRTGDGTTTSGPVSTTVGAADGVRLEVVLPTTTVEAGGEIEGHVVVTNDSGEPIRGTGCGPEFWLTLHNDKVDQQFGQSECLQTYELPSGESTYPVKVMTSYGGCNASPGEPGSPSDFPQCGSDGTAPKLPVGEYQAELHAQSGLPTDADPITITLT